MAVMVKGVYTRGVIRPEHSDELEKYKAKLEEGEEVAITFRKWASSKSERAFRYFHAICRRYADYSGYSMEHAKHELCIQFGIAVEYVPEFDPPEWKTGTFVEYHRTLYFRKSTTVYTSAEMAALIDQSLNACNDAGIPIDDLIRENGDYYDRKRAV